jgi:hypothetical protein
MRRLAGRSAAARHSADFSARVPGVLKYVQSLLRTFWLLLGALVLILPLGVGVGVPAAAAAAPPMMTAHLDGTVALVANGGVEMVVTVTCSRGEYLGLSTTLQEALPDHTLAGAAGSAGVYCKAGTQQLRVDALEVGSSFLRTGTAAATLDVQCAGHDVCSSLSERRVQLSRSVLFDKPTARLWSAPAFSAALNPAGHLSASGTLISLKVGLTCPAGHGPDMTFSAFLDQDGVLLEQFATSVSCSPTLSELTVTFPSTTAFHRGPALLEFDPADSAAPKNPDGTSAALTVFRQVQLS